MAGSIKNCTGTFSVYSINEFDYIGTSSDLKRRMYRHKSHKKLSFIPTYKVLKEFDNYKDALAFEDKYQLDNGYEVRHIANQEGSKNSMARKVLNTITGITYDTIKLASIGEGLDYSSLRHLILKDNYYLKRI